MPAKSGAQLRAAYAAKERGEEWGAEMVEKTSRSTRVRLMRTQPKKKTKKTVRKK